MKQIYRLKACRLNTCRLIKKIPILTAMALLFGCATAPEPKQFTSNADKYAYTKEYMRWYIKEQMKDNDITGLSVALVDDQKIVWSEGFGYADKKNGIKATPETKYRAGSITKLFTAMSVMKLAEEGRMNIDKPLRKYLPEFSIKSRFGSTDSVTPRNIMTHHSGLPGDWLDRMFSRNPLSYTEYVKIIHNEYMAYRPNTILGYSNLGITLLGHSIERVSGEKYASFVEKTLLKPMRMRHSDIKMKLEGNGASKSYEKQKMIDELAIGMLPAGALNTTVVDLSHLAMMINADGVYKGKRILSSSTLDKMFTVQNKNVALDVGEKIGLGYFINEVHLGKRDTTYGHGGATIGHYSYFSVSPHSKLGVVVMANSTGANVQEIADKLVLKAWEAKTGKVVSKKSVIVNHMSDFEGIYDTIIGKVTMEKISDSKYRAETSEGEFVLERDENNSYGIEYKMLGLFPISDSSLKKIKLYTDDIDGYHVIVGYLNSTYFIAGTKIEKPESIPDSWLKYVGRYEILNNFEPENWKIKACEFNIKNGYPLVNITYALGDVGIVMLRPVTDTEAIIEGLGRGRQETVYVKDDMIHVQGLRFRKMKDKK